MPNLHNIILEAVEFGEISTSEKIEAVQENKGCVPSIDISSFSDFIIFSDETGDVGLRLIDDNYPYFAINFCIFRKDDYLKFSKNLKELKMRYFNSDLFIFHEVEITQKYRKLSNYKFNNNRSQQLLAQMNAEQFYNFINDFSNLLKNTEYKQVTAIVDKRKVKVDKSNNKAIKNKQDELYRQTLRSGLTGVFNFLVAQREQNKKTSIVFEETGIKESTNIKSIFYDFCNEVSGLTKQNVNLEYEVAPKKANNDGLQLADMTAKASVKIHSQNYQSDRSCALVKEKLIAKNGNFYNNGLFVISL